MLEQLLSALEYLHGYRPQVVHRDIKPQNILVLYWESERVHVKLADFGSSKQADYLKTFCGTLLYAAPEVYGKQLDHDKSASRYASLVDIWSLGVVVAERECGGLPKHHNRYRTGRYLWAEVIVGHVQEYRHQGDNKLLSLLDNMLVVEPGARQTASTCHGAALLLRGYDTPSSLPELVSSCEQIDTATTSSDSCEGDFESGSSTPRAVPPVAISSGRTAEQSEASTIRDYTQENDAAGKISRSSGRGTVPAEDPSLMEDLGYSNYDLINSMLNPSDVSWQQRSSASSPDTQLGQGTNASQVVGELWNPEQSTPCYCPGGASLGQNEDHQDATESVDSDLRFRILHTLQNAVRDGEGLDAEEAGVGVAASLQSTRKRSRRENGSPAHISASSSTNLIEGDEALKGEAGGNDDCLDCQDIKRSKGCMTDAQV